MPFTVQELENISNQALDFHIKGEIHKQNIQAKPLLKALEAKKKTFPGGKDNITVRVKGDYTTTIQGFSGDDQVGYKNPANVKEGSYPWKEIHAGIKFTGTELKKNGIVVLDSNTGERTGMADQREKVALSNLLEDKLEDLSEGWARGMNDMFWKDGTQDSTLVAGIRSIVVDDPTAATVVGGIDQSANTWWRNRADLTVADATLAKADEQNLIKKLNREMRQLTRYEGGRPTHAFCGSDFLDQIENEMRAKGQFTQTGWAQSGAIDISLADQRFKNLVLEYDPTLDDLGLAKRAYFLDLKNIRPYVMSGEDMKQHTPSRPEDRYVYYRAITWTGGMVAIRRASSGVYGIA